MMSGRVEAGTLPAEGIAAENRGELGLLCRPSDTDNIVPCDFLICDFVRNIKAVELGKYIHEYMYF